MRWLALVLLAGLAPAATAQEPGPAVTVLLFHPHPDDVDPFGFAWSAGVDAFDARYSGLVVDDGRFDYPYFVADGVLPVENIPDPARPYDSALRSYREAVDARSEIEAPVRLGVEARVVADTVVADITLGAAPETGGGVTLFAALVEDPVEYEAPAAFSNGITRHRFTVRAFQAIGGEDLVAPAERQALFDVDPAWRRELLSVAVWLQAGNEPLGRFQPREVVQATHAAVGGPAVLQEGKGVLAEMYSATWCEPCLYGDLAIEEMAVQLGGAAPLSRDAGPRYFEPPSSWPIIALAALAGAVAVGGARMR